MESKTLVDMFGSPPANVTNGVSSIASSNGEPSVDNYPDVLRLILRFMKSIVSLIERPTRVDVSVDLTTTS